MAKLVWAVLCHKSVIDKDSNQLSLFDTIEQLKIEVSEPLPAKAAVPLVAQLATFWTRTDLEAPEKVPARIRFIAPSGKTLATSPFEVDVQSKPNHRVIMKMQGLPVVGSGRYWFVVELKVTGGRFKPQARLPLDVSIDLLAPQPTDKEPS